MSFSQVFPLLFWSTAIIMFKFFSAESVFNRQILTSKDGPRAERVSVSKRFGGLCDGCHTPL